MYRAGPTPNHGKKDVGPTADSLLLLSPAPPLSVIARAELGGQECHEEEGDAHGQRQVFPLGAGSADALLKLGHLGALSLKVFCGKRNRPTGKGWAVRWGGGHAAAAAAAAVEPGM